MGKKEEEMQAKDLEIQESFAKNQRHRNKIRRVRCCTNFVFITILLFVVVNLSNILGGSIINIPNLDPIITLSLMAIGLIFWITFTCFPHKIFKPS